jgi:hypothetical protein
MPTALPRAGRLVMMGNPERIERIRSLVESLSADQAERDRLKKRADESLEQFHDAVRELVGGTRPPGERTTRAAPARS